MRRDFEKEKMLSYMKKKYGEEFVYVESYAGQAGKAYSAILVESRLHRDRQALVRLSKREGRRYYEDNYLSYLLKDKLEEKIGAFASQCFGECKIYYKIPMFVFPPEFRSDMSADVFLKNPYSMPQFYIYPRSGSKSCEEWEQRAEEFRKLNAEKGYKIRGTVSLADTENDYDMINEENFASSDYEGYEAFNELVFSMDKNGNFRYLRWLSEKKD